jgi:hypothetical protein
VLGADREVYAVNIKMRSAEGPAESIDEAALDENTFISSEMY